ncbi:hypothetical protein BGW42_006578 [Actinomortierella wolfii]|nr:hypothetical protein BGW42_006578 [Actinomortierella wolfii]
MGQMLALGTDQFVAKELVSDYIRDIKSGKVREVSFDAIAKMAEQALEVGMTFKSMGTTREEAVAPALDKALWDTFLTRYAHRFPPEVAFRISKLRDIADMRYPNEWNPAARLMKRKVIMHVGPTNSGKTYQALMRLQQAETGVYLSPLRLLAHEVFERMNNAGAKCNLVTGEERRYAVYKPDGTPDPAAAGLVSCTVEMADTSRKVDVAVVDEIQMIADQERGWAWTNALMGLAAQEIHLCGEPTVVELVRKICKLTNDDFEVKRYDRLSKLELQEKSLYGRLDKIEKGDCLVTFSRKNIFLAKKAIEEETGLRCAVAYGSLPPESRSLQAKLFNDPNSGYDVLVASDAIGMGLNLNIRRIIFEAVQKFDGSVVRSLSLTQLKQIAGRAGRFGTEYAVGQATTLVQRDLPVLKRALAAPMIDIHRAVLQPPFELIERFAHHLPGAPFSEVLKTFEKFTRSSDIFFPGPLRNMITIAKMLDHLPLNLNDRYPFISSPIPLRDKNLVPKAVRMAEALSAEKPISIDELVQLPTETTDPANLKLELLESDHRTIMLYLWLSQRFERIYEGGIESLAYKRKLQCERLIEASLRQQQTKRLLKQLVKKERMEAKKMERELKVGMAKSSFQKLWPFNASSNNASQGTVSGTRTSIDGHGESTRVKPIHPSFNRGIPLNMKIVIRVERLQGHPFSNTVEYMTTPQIQVANIPWQYPHTKDIIKVEIWDVVDKGVRSGSLKRQSNGLKISNATSAQTMEPHPEFALDASTIDVYRNADGAIIMYDGSKPWTFEYAVTALTQAPTNIPVLLLKNFTEEDETVNEQAEARLKELLDKHNNHRSALPCAPANLVRHIETNMKSGMGLKEIHDSFGLPFLNTVREMHRRKFDQKTQEIEELLVKLDHHQRQMQLTRSMYQSQHKQRQSQRHASNADSISPTSPRQRGPLPPAIETSQSKLDPPRMTTSTPNSPARKTRNEVTNVDILSPTPLAAAPPAVLLEFNAGQLEEAFFHNIDHDDPTPTVESGSSSKSAQLSKNDAQGHLYQQDSEQVLAELGNPMVAQDEDIGDVDDMLLDGHMNASLCENEHEPISSVDQQLGNSIQDDSPIVDTLQRIGDLSLHPLASATTDDEGFVSGHGGFEVASKPLALTGYRMGGDMEDESNPWGRTSPSLSSHHSPGASYHMENDEQNRIYTEQSEMTDGGVLRGDYEDIGSKRSSLMMIASTDPRHSAASGLVDVDLDVNNTSVNSNPLPQDGSSAAVSDGEGEGSPRAKTSKKKKSSGKKKSRKGH